MSVFRWTGQASSNFGTAANWYDVTTGAPSTVVPGITDDALVTASGSIGGSADVFELALTGTTTGLTVTGQLQGRLVYLEGAVTLAATAQLDAQNLLDIGDGTTTMPGGPGEDEISLDGGSRIDVVANAVNGGGIVVGQNGANTMLSLTQQGTLGSEMLSYAYGASAALTVGSNAGVGVVSVSGSDSALGGFGKSVVGAARASGLIEVSAGGRVVLGADAAGEGLSLGVSAGRGSLTMAGASQALLLGQTAIGASGTGMLSITGGSGLVAQSTTGAALLVGALAGSSGSVLVSDAYSFASVSGGLDVGGYGAGTLTVENGARVVSGSTPSPTTPALSMAVDTGGTGTVTVASEAEFVALGAGIAVGVYGSGVLDVTSADVTVTVAAGANVSALDVGVMAGAHGVVNVGGGLIDDTQSAGMFVGFGGSGTMTIAEIGGRGGLVLTGDPLAGAGFSLGVDHGSDGTVSISGSASGLLVYGTVADGLSGHGSISVTAGGHLVAELGATSVGLTLGGAGGSGAMTIDTGAQVYVLGQTIIGTQGTGTLSITGGSSFTGTVDFPTNFYPPLGGRDAAMVVGDASTATGSVLISDPSTYVPLTGGLVVGEYGTGSLTVTNAAVLAVGGALSDGETGLILGDQLGSSGTITLSNQAAMLARGGIEVGGLGHGELDISQSTLTIDAVNGGQALSIGGSYDYNNTFSRVSVAGGAIIDSGGNGILLGDGTLAISQVGSHGGTVLTGGGAYDNGLSVGAFDGQVGTVTVSGAASGLGVFGPTAIYAGSMTLSDGARLVTGNSAAGTYSFQAGLTVDGDLSLTGAASASVLGQSFVNEDGTLSILDGSGYTVRSTGGPALEVGFAGYAPASVLVSGAASYASLAGGLAVGFGGSGGAGGSSTVTVANGALMAVSAASAATAAVSIGNVTSGDRLTVDGSGSRLTDTGFFQVGDSEQAGTADVAVSGGGSLMVATVSGQTGPAAMIGNAGGVQGASSSVTVTGSGSDWAIGGTLLVAGNPFGAATLDVAAGGQVSASQVTVNDLIDGIVTVEGAGSVLHATSVVVTSGTLAANAGGVFQVGNGIALGGSGTANLSGGTLATATTVTLAVGANLNGVSGSSTVSASSIVDLGNIRASGGTLSCLGTITGSGLITLGGGTLVLGTGEAAGVAIDYLSGATLVAQSAAHIAGTITGWASGDFIDLKTVAATSESFANGTLSLLGSNSHLVGTLKFSGSLMSSNFSLTSMGGGGTEIGYHG